MQSSAAVFTRSRAAPVQGQPRYSTVGKHFGAQIPAGGVWRRCTQSNRETRAPRRGGYRVYPRGVPAHGTYSYLPHGTAYWVPDRCRHAWLGWLAVSLINKVLRDLEAQRDTVSERKARSPLTQDNLRPVRSVKRHLSRQQLLGIGLAVATIAVGVFVWNQWGAKLLMGSKPPVAPKTIAPVPEPAKAVAVPPA